LKRIMPLISMRNYVGVAPRGLVRERDERSSHAGWSWPSGAEYVASVAQRVFESVALARQKANISERRVFLAGFGAAGTAALRVAMRYPRRFAGVLSLCGGFPEGGNPLARIAEARRVPIFLACGQDAQNYAMSAVCDNLRLLHTAGMTVSLRLYPGRDELSPLMLPDMDRWIMEQLSSTRSVVKN
jgi:phospholipase/carboxylesterase